MKKIFYTPKPLKRKKQEICFVKIRFKKLKIGEPTFMKKKKRLKKKMISFWRQPRVTIGKIEGKKQVRSEEIRKFCELGTLFSNIVKYKCPSTRNYNKISMLNFVKEKSLVYILSPTSIFKRHMSVYSPNRAV